MRQDSRRRILDEHRDQNGDADEPDNGADHQNPALHRSGGKMTTDETFQGIIRLAGANHIGCQERVRSHRRRSLNEGAAPMSRASAAECKTAREMP